MKSIRLVEEPHLKRNISILALNAAVHDTTQQLNHFFGQGGNTLHIHEEGGETKLCEEVGRWLYDHRKNSDTIFCCMIGHESEDGLERKDSDSLQEDILKHKSILKVPSLHVVYLDPPSDSETYFQIIETLVENIRNKNINSYAFRNWTADEIRTAIHYADTSGVPRPSAIITTEFSSAIPKTPLWNGYIPFDTSLREAAIELNLTVWAWVSDINQPLFIPVNERSWFLTADRMERWLTDENEYIVRKLSDMAISKGLTLRQVNAESLLHQPFRVIGIISKDATNLGDLDEFYDIAGI